MAGVEGVLSGTPLFCLFVPVSLYSGFAFVPHWFSRELMDTVTAMSKHGFYFKHGNEQAETLWMKGRYLEMVSSVCYLYFPELTNRKFEHPKNIQSTK